MTLIIRNILLYSGYGPSIVVTHQSFQPVDVNQDGDVNILDLVAVSGSIGMVPHNPRADVNGDGFVNVLDLITVYTSERLGRICASTEGQRC